MSAMSAEGYVLLPTRDDDDHSASQAAPSPTLLAPTWTWEDDPTSDETLFFPRTPRQLEEAPPDTEPPHASAMLDAFFNDLFFQNAPAHSFHP
jgi:hypothetical protein